MRLDHVEIFTVGTPPPGWGGRYFILVRVSTDTGLHGWGEVYAASVGPKAMRAVIDDVFARHMRGENPEHIELMFRRAYSSGFTQRPDLTVMGAFSGLEIACWDILGKARGRPVHALLGGKVNDRLRSYSYLYPGPGDRTPAFWGDAAANARVAGDMADQGFTAIKVDPAGPYTIRGGHQPALADIEQCVTFCDAIRQAVGTRADILFGTHGQFTPSGAIRLGRAIERFDPLWFEEPVPPDDIPALAQVARATTIPVATGERLTTRAEFLAVLRAGAAGILQPAIGRAGGIWETRKIAAMAESFGVQIAPHLYCGPVEWAASVHLGASIPNLLMIETIQQGGTFHRQLIGEALPWRDGFIEVPDTPGLGIEIDMGVVAAHPYDEDALHLQMQEAPPDPRGAGPFGGGAPRD
ncbi:mandelate racemase/muconate lactonizing enzyme family protein [Paracoccus sp. TK19116]|uniref:Mandelate racemase/muconate lactonizing enzyme family protein n=1 Tax=Paracoccus albicereus TaxID=2922394 RepID=A0ABT1MSM4_9RHOB|nr:mandelate racemase/muconate lactonizing enzyme family protein [Paracoccus albicereus]MCQ0971297.1 mandelate racemase/muconate lactonizing enzyme family protein [Paracoccus albicereus]